MKRAGYAIVSQEFFVSYAECKLSLLSEHCFDESEGPVALADGLKFDED